MKKVLLMLSHDVEDVEALATRALLVRAGVEVITATFQRALEIETAFGLKVNVDAHVDNLDISSFDMLVIPGGKYVSETIDLHDKMQVLARQFNELDKPIAAICAGPRFLGRAGLLDGINFTAYPGSEQDILKGHYHSDQKAMTDGRFITARGAGCVYEFVTHMISYLFDTNHAQALLEQIKH
jgi:4-methyl-5(b-hydroxyethyl)-thiazole monophosphate biosynthesis